MQKHVTKKEARKWLGKLIFALKKDGSVISGKLVKINGNQLILQQPRDRKVRIKAFIPLVLFDLLAIGGHHHGFGHHGFGHGFGHPFGHHGFGHPFGGFF